MWSAINSEYVKQLVLSNQDEYPYYMAHTVTNLGTGSNSNTVTFKVYFSKEPITASGLYNYVLPSDSVLYSVCANTASSNYYNARVSTSAAGGNVAVNSYEFIYTNAEFSGNSIQPDITATAAVTQSHFDGFGVLLACILLSTVFYRLIRR